MIDQIDIRDKPPSVDVIINDSVSIHRMLAKLDSKELVDLGDLLGGPVWLIHTYQTVLTKRGRTARFVLQRVQPAVFG